MDFFSKFKKSDDQAKPTSDDQQEPEYSSSNATENYSSGDVTKGADDASEEYGKPSSFGDDTTESYSDKASGGGDAAVGTYKTGEYDQSGGGYGEDGYSKKPSYTDEYEQPQLQGGYVEDTEKPSETAGGYGEDINFSKKPSYGDEAAGTDEYDKPQGFPSGTETDNFGNYTSTEQGADSAEPYDADATETYRKKPSAATTGDHYAADAKYNE